MNVLVVLMDSLNFHCLQPYGATHVATPNLARFARRAVVFDNHFIGSTPCMPARRELMTGRREFLWRGWGHIEPWDRHIAHDAARAGRVTQMITDHYHYWENAAHGYFEPFHGMEFVRGHELDMWDTAPIRQLPQWAASIDTYRNLPAGPYQGWGSRFYANARRFERSEADYPGPQVLQLAAKWLKDNLGGPPFLLWTECFDPHEPHFLPMPWRTMYSPDGKDHPEYTCWPPYQHPDQLARFVKQASEEELAWIRAQYMGKVSMLDHWFGKLLDQMDRLDLWKSTTVIVTTDHGHDLAWSRLAPTVFGKQYPHPESHARIPLMIAHPSAKPGRVSALTTAVDTCATVRDLMGDPEPNGPDGRSLMPLVMGRTRTHHDWVMYGWFGEGVGFSTADWTLIQGCRSDRPLYWYSTTAMRVSADMDSGFFIPGVAIPQWRVPAASPDLPAFLWRREPFTLTPVNRLDTEAAMTATMRKRLSEALRAVATPPEQFARLDLG